MDIFLFVKALALGVVQGITEFLPISSSGHLVVLEQVFGMDSQSLAAFDILLHLGTFLALCAFFRKEIVQMLREFGGLFQGKITESLLAKLVLATIPAGVVGILFNGWIETTFRNVRAVGIFFLVTAMYFFLVERIAKQNKQQTGWKDALSMGIAQIFGLLPGISRSGSVIGGGMLSGLTREAAARFSFLMALPAIGGATLIQGLEVAHRGFAEYHLADLWLFYVTGFIVAVISSFFAIKIIVKLFQKHSLAVFSVYLACIGLILTIVYF